MFKIFKKSYWVKDYDNVTGNYSYGTFWRDLDDLYVSLRAYKLTFLSHATSIYKTSVEKAKDFCKTELGIASYQSAYLVSVVCFAAVFSLRLSIKLFFGH
ncbi:hypothetical protein [Corynespora cassiicola fusarivirus 1]|nr:hypothetical protein [Corynespora cassiicola fusarivirus 1]